MKPAKNCCEELPHDVPEIDFPPAHDAVHPGADIDALTLRAGAETACPLHRFGLLAAGKAFLVPRSAYAHRPKSLRRKRQCDSYRTPLVTPMNGTCLRTARYSAIYRPACRISHTGVCSAGSHRTARMNGPLCHACVIGCFQRVRGRGEESAGGILFAARRELNYTPVSDVWQEGGGGA